VRDICVYIYVCVCVRVCVYVYIYMYRYMYMYMGVIAWSVCGVCVFGECVCRQYV